MKAEKLDLSIWVTQQAFATEQKVTIQAVQNWIRRKQIKTYVLAGNTTLVNRLSLSINTSLGRPRNKVINSR